MERSRHITPQKSQIKTTERYLRGLESGRYIVLDERTDTLSRKGRATTSHEPHSDYERDYGSAQTHIAERQDYINYERSGSRAENEHLTKNKKKPIFGFNQEHKIRLERLRGHNVDTSVKEASEKPKKVHFQMQESKSTPLSVRVKAIKQKHGSQSSKYYTPSPYQQDQINEKYRGHAPDPEDGIVTNDADFKYAKHSYAKSVDEPRLRTDQYTRKTKSKSQYLVDFSDSDDLSDSELDLESYSRSYRSRRPQTPGKYSLFSSVPDNQATNYNYIPSRIPRPTSGMLGSRKSALKKSSSFDSRDVFSVTKASTSHSISNNSKLQKTFEDESIILERPSSSRKIRSQAKNSRRYTPFTPDSPKKPVRYKPLMEDFESESSDENSTDSSEQVDVRHGPSRTRKGNPPIHDNCHPVESSDSDSDAAFQQIEVYVPTAVFKHAPCQLHDNDQDHSMNTIHKRPAKEYARPERMMRHNEDRLENHDRSYEESQNGDFYRMPVDIKRSEGRSDGYNRVRKRDKEQIEESHNRYEVPTQRDQRQVEEENDNGLLPGRRHYFHQPKPDKNMSVQTAQSYKKMQLDDKNIKLFRRAEDSHRMFMSVWLPPRTSNGGSVKPKRSLLDTPEHFFMLRRIAKRN